MKSYVELESLHGFFFFKHHVAFVWLLLLLDSAACKLRRIPIEACRGLGLRRQGRPPGLIWQESVEDCPSLAGVPGSLEARQP